MTWRRVLFCSLIFLVLLLGVTWWTVTRSGFARDLVLGQLARFVAADVKLDGAELDPLGGQVRLQNLRVVPEVKETGARRDALDLPEVVLGVSMNPLGGAGELRSIFVDRAELDIDLASEAPFDFASLIPPEVAERDSDGRLPSIRIRNLTVRLHLPSETSRILELKPVKLSLLPDAQHPERMILRGSCPNPFGGTIHLRGEALETGERFELTAEAEEFRIDSEAMSLVGADVVQLFDERKIAGLVAPTFWIRYPFRATGEVTAAQKPRVGGGIRGSFRDLQVEPPVVPYLLTHLSGQIQLTPDRDGTLELRVERSGTDLQVVGDFSLHGLTRARQAVRIRARASDIPLDPRLEVALSRLPAAREVYDALEPRNGRGDLDLYVSAGERIDSGDGDSEPRTQVDVTLRDCDLRFRGFVGEGRERGVGFPYAWTNASLDVRVRDDFVAIENLVADGLAGGKLTGSGQFDFEREEARLDFEAKALPCSDALRTALAGTSVDAPRIYDEFRPRGNFDVDVRLRKRSASSEMSWAIGLEPNEASIEWESFPYRVPNLAGRVDITSEAARFHVAGRDGETKIEARGRIDLAEDGAQEVWVSAENARLDDKQRQALVGLDPSFAESWDLFSPAGNANIEFLGWRPRGAPELSYDVRADLLGATARFSPFPVDLRQLTGPVIVHGDGRETHVEILGLTGQGLDALLSFQGTLDFAPDEAPLTDLEVIAKGVRMREELGTVLAETEMVTPTIWNLAKVSGTADAVIEIRRDREDKDWRKSLAVDLRQVQSDAEILPDVLTRLSGSVHIDEEHVIHIDRLEGLIGEAPLLFEKGKIRQETDGTVIDLELSADRYPVDDRLANLLSGDVKRAYLERHARGRVSLVGVGVQVRVPKVPPAGAEGLGLEMTFSGGEFRAHGLSLDLGVAVEDIGGFVVLDGGYVRPDASEIRGQLGGLRFEALGQDFVDARGAFVATHERFVIPTGNVRVHGGVVRGLAPNVDATTKSPLVSYEFDESRRLGVRFEFIDVDLGKAVARLELGAPYRGLVSGKVGLTLNVDDPTTLDLSANVGVRDGWLGDAPIFRSIYGLLQQEKRPTFHAALLDVKSKGQSLEIRRLLLLSALLRVEGTGKLDYDGYLQLQLEFPNLFPEASPLTLLPGIYRAVANALVRFDVTGYIGNLRSGPRFVPLESKPEKRAVEPLAGRRGTLPPIFRE